MSLDRGPTLIQGSQIEPAPATISAQESSNAGQLNNFLDIPTASTGAVGGGRGAQRPISCRAAIGPASFPRGRLAIGLVPALEPGPPPASGLPSVRVSVRALAIDRGNFPRDPATIGPESATAIARGTSPTIVRAASKTAGSGKTTGSSTAAKLADQIATIIRDSISGSIIPIGPGGESTRPAAGQPGALTGWFGWGSGYTETAYAYGENVYYGEDDVYYGDQPVATAEEYANQAAAIVGTRRKTSIRKPQSGCRSAYSR